MRRVPARIRYPVPVSHGKGKEEGRAMAQPPAGCIFDSLGEFQKIKLTFPSVLLCIYANFVA